MADKGFEMEDLLVPLGFRLNIPPFLDKQRQMLPSDIRATKSIAAVRIHVERAIGQFKEYRQGGVFCSYGLQLQTHIFCLKPVCRSLASMSAKSFKAMSTNSLTC